MCSYRHKNHFLVSYLKYATKIYRLRVNLLLFFPLHNKLISNRILGFLTLCHPLNR